MFIVFHRRHYDKTMLVVLSHFVYLQIKSNVGRFRRVPCEKFSLSSAARANASDNAEQISLKQRRLMPLARNATVSRIICATQKIPL